MSRPVRNGLGFVVVVVLLAGLLLTRTTSRAVSTSEACTGPWITIEATPEILPAGRNCRVILRPDPQTPRTTVQVEYHGKIIESTAEGITLDVVEWRREETASGPIHSLPVVNRLFRNVGIARPAPGGKPTWIAADAIQYVHLLPPAVAQQPLFTP